MSQSATTEQTIGISRTPVTGTGLVISRSISRVLASEMNVVGSKEIVQALGEVVSEDGG